MIKKKIFSVVISVWLVLLCGCGSSNIPINSTKTFDTNLSVLFQKALNKALKDNNATGAVLGVRTPKGSIIKVADGYAVEENLTKMTTNLSFRIGSITKTFTATMIFMLIDNGKLKLDTTLDKLLPNLKIVMSKKITVKNLLEMRSGLGKYLSNKNFTKFLMYDPEHVWTPKEIAEYSNYKASGKEGIPGGDFLYNNGNYILLGLIIEKLTNMSYKNAINKYILKPLSMKHTYLPVNLNIPNAFAYGYEYNNDFNRTVDKTYYLNPSIAWSAGGFISNVDDLLTWVKVYTDGDLISNNLYKKQFTLIPIKDKSKIINGYGLGIMKYKFLIGHDGYIPPYGSWIATYKGYKFVLLVNGTKKVKMPAIIASHMLIDIINTVNSKIINATKNQL